jgi:sec-independent protein translocase protein TatA
MGELSIYHWLVVLFIVLLLFGGRKIPQLMSGLGDGVRLFREGVRGKGTRAQETSGRTDKNPTEET